MKNHRLHTIAATLAVALLLTGVVVSADLSAGAAEAKAGSIKVNVDNYVRAETAFQFDKYMKLAGGINQWHHNLAPTPLDKQNVIRMNRDTLYSFAVVDISKGATLTIPDAGERYLSVMVVNEKEYINKVFHEPGVHQLTVEELGSPHISLTARTLADVTDPADVKIANALQKKLKIEAASAKPWTHPNYDRASYEKTLQLLLKLSEGVADTKRMFGKKEEVSEVRHLLGAAFGWGGLPEYEAFYITKNEPRPAGKYQLTVKDVPVDGFCSISVYNREGYFEKNEYDAYSINNFTAKPNEDGSVTINFGTSRDGQDNFLYVTDGWNYAVRLYRPRKEVLDGTFVFPEPQPVK